MCKELINIQQLSSIQHLRRPRDPSMSFIIINRELVAWYKYRDTRDTRDTRIYILL
jgi:hypothetical protein